MKPEIENYIHNVLSKIAILDETDVAFEQVEILEYRTHFENGALFTHQNGNNYALAILNAITQESYYTLSKFIKKTKNLSVKNIQNELESHYLKCYVSGDSKGYSLWKSGDIGIAFLQVDDENKSISVRYTNQSAKERS